MTDIAGDTAPPQPSRNGAGWTSAFRRWIHERDYWTCAYCLKLVDEAAPNRMDRPEIDHIKPRRQNGSDAPENLATACRRCNIAKGDRTPEQWRADDAAKSRGERPSKRIRHPRREDEEKRSARADRRAHLQEHFGHLAYFYARDLGGVTPLQKLICYYMATCMGSSGVYHGKADSLATFCCCEESDVRAALQDLVEKRVVARGVHPDDDEWGWVFPFVWVDGGYFKKSDNW